MSIFKLQQLPSAINAQKLKPGASVAFIFCENDNLIDETIRYFLNRRFARIFMFITEPEQYRNLEQVINIRFDFTQWEDIWPVLNMALPHLHGRWLYWGLNGEFLYYPFCENRNIDDLSDFLKGERRDSLPCSIIDLYTGDIETHGDGVSMVNTHLDKINYYATPSHYSLNDFEEQELDRIKFIYGGLRWRYSEFVAEERRRIDRVAYFYVDSRLSFDQNGFTRRPEFFTYRCYYHHNVTGAVMSFHMARYLRHNPTTRRMIPDFMWDGSQHFSWNSSQLLRMGIIETGQWF